MRHGRTTSRRLLLASRSPRRRQLLDEAGIAHVPVETGVDDGQLSPSHATTPAAWVTAMAYLKARAAFEHATASDLVLAADTVCVLDGQVIGQPRDTAHASEMIAAFSGRAHQALTGVCVLNPVTGQRSLRHDVAIVHLGPLSTASMDEYIASEQWRGKAGGYNYFERLSDAWPLRVEGDPQTVVGLPIRLVRAMLAGHPSHAAHAQHAADPAPPREITA